MSNIVLPKPSYNILQYLCDFIHVLIFVLVSKCQKNPKLTIYSVIISFMSLLHNIITSIML